MIGPTLSLSVRCLLVMVQGRQAGMQLPAHAWIVDALSPGDVLNSVHVTAACTRRTVARHGIGMTARAGRQQACRVVPA